jgi:hypothetical protein
MNKYTHPLLVGGIDPIFSQKFFQNFFYEYFTRGIEPPFWVSKCHIWGGYGGGEGVVSIGPPHAK